MALIDYDTNKIIYGKGETMFKDSPLMPSGRNYNNMNFHRHGECILKPIQDLPKEAKLVNTTKDHIVGHSETGHHHVLELKTAALKVYELDGKTYLDVGTQGKLVHKKSGTNIHKTQQIEPGKYEVIIKHSFDYFKKALTRVRD